METRGNPEVEEVQVQVRPRPVPVKKTAGSSSKAPASSISKGTLPSFYVDVPGVWPSDIYFLYFSISCLVVAGTREDAALLSPAKSDRRISARLAGAPAPDVSIGHPEEIEEEEDDEEPHTPPKKAAKGKKNPAPKATPRKSKKAAPKNEPEFEGIFERLLLFFYYFFLMCFTRRIFLLRQSSRSTYRGRVEGHSLGKARG